MEKMIVSFFGIENAHETNQKLSQLYTAKLNPERWDILVYYNRNKFIQQAEVKNVES